MRLDHLLSKEYPHLNKVRIIPRSIGESANSSRKENTVLWDRRTRKRPKDCCHASSHCIVFNVRKNIEGRVIPGQRTLTTAQRGRERNDLKRLKDLERFWIKASQRAYYGTRREDAGMHFSLGLRDWSQDNQAKKSIGWMPRHQAPMKDVASCEKLR